MSESLIGHSLGRVDGQAKVDGSARYVDDVAQHIPCLYGATVRTRAAHGVIERIEFDEAFDWSAFTVVTAEDIPGDNVVALMTEDQPALVPVGKKFLHAEEPVVLIAGVHRQAVREAMQHVRVVERKLPAVHDIDSAIAAEVSVYQKDNLIKFLTIEKGEEASYHEAFNSAAHIVEGVYHTGAQEQMYIEPQGMLAHWEGGRVVVRGSLQCPYYVHRALKQALNLENDADVVVAHATTGGGFGGKEEYPSILAIHTALLAKKAGCAVKIVYARDEDIRVTTKRHPARVRHRMALSADGSVLAVDIDIDIDAGAYVTLTPVVLSRAVLHAAGPYRCPLVRIRGRAWATNTPPFGAYRGFGAPQVTFAYERQMHKAAIALGMSPMEFRRKNMLRVGDTTSTGGKLEYSVASEQVLDSVEAALEARPLLPRKQDRLRRGRGLAFYFHGAGFTGRGEERLKGKVTVAALPDGRFEVRSASTDIGQGVMTIFTQMAASALGLNEGAIVVAPVQTDMVPDSGPTVASRTCMVVGSVVASAAREVREELERTATNAAGPHDLQALARVYIEEHGVLERTATYRSPAGIDFDDIRYKGAAYPVYGWAACGIDICVDLDTYEIKVEGCVHAVDVGKAINPTIVKGQIEGGTLQALGWALWEAVHYCDGRVLNHRMTDSIIPTAMEAPEMHTIIVEDPYPHGPFGAKGVGEIPMGGPGAALANALADALKHEDVESTLGPDRLPLLPEHVQQLLAGKPLSAWLPHASSDEAAGEKST